MKRSLAAVLVVVLVAGAGIAVAVVGVQSRGSHDDWSPLTPTPGVSPVTSPSPVPSSDPLAAFYDQTLHWSQCRDHDECAKLRVPLDYADPTGTTIELALLLRPANKPDQRVGDLVINPGGPGISGVEFAAAADQVYGKALLDHFDIVGFDPRGVGGSDPVDCLTDGQLDRYIASVAAPESLDQAADYERWNREIGAGCVARSGALASHVSTVEAARDLDVLRAALGQGTLDYLGSSYGTELGTVYADLFPQRVGRFVLDGALDPTIGTRELELQQAAGFETELRQYLAACVASGTCPVGSTVDAGEARLQQLLQQIVFAPLPAGGGRVLQEGNALYGVIYPLYSKELWPSLTQALSAALHGDGSVLMELSDAYTSRGPKGYSDNSMEALYAIDCLDDPWSIPASKVDGQLPAFEKASPTFGAMFAWSLTGCSGWKPRAEEPQPPVGAPGAAPIVVVGTTRDPVTPVAWARHLASLLDSGVLVTRDGDGHTGYNTGNSCVDHAVEGYLVDGTVPRDGLAC